MDIAKEMTREALPIKCLEAVILGMYPCSSRSCCMICSDLFQVVLFYDQTWFVHGA